MFESISSFFRKIMKSDQKELLDDTSSSNSKDAAKERLHVVLMQDRANVSADFLELMKQEIIDVIKKYIVVDEDQIDVRLTNQENEDGTTGVPVLYANIPILNIRNDVKGEVLSESEANKAEEEKFEQTEIAGTEPVNLNNDDSYQNSVIDDNKVEESTPITEEENDTTYNSNLSSTPENYESYQNSEIDEDETGDDITFDDLLKVAEEEEKIETNNELDFYEEKKPDQINQDEEDSEQFNMEKVEQNVQKIPPKKKSAKRGRPKKKSKSSKK